MPLTRVTGHLVQAHGDQPADPLPDAGVVQWTPAAHGTWGRALRGRGPVEAKIVDGEMAAQLLVPGPWIITVLPAHGIAWDAFTVEVPTVEEIDLIDLAPVIVIDGERWARGVSVEEAIDLGGAFALRLSDGTRTDPIQIPGGSGGPVAVETDEDGTWILTTESGTLPVSYAGDGTWQIGA